jgi:hypothetical protein
MKRRIQFRSSVYRQHLLLSPNVVPMGSSRSCHSSSMTQGRGAP